MTVSRHPVDELIRELIGSGRMATAGEVDQIVGRMATAPFMTREQAIPAELHGLAYGSRMIRAREDSLFAHLVKRVLDDRQWVEGATTAEYLNDLRRAVRDPSARLCLYTARGGPIAAAITSTSRAVPPARQGARPLPLLLVVYSADRGMILSGYQVSTLEAARIPEAARWLR